MSYLIKSDYDRLIQEVSLQQIISGNLLLKTQGEIAAISEIKSYLSSKYDVDSEFTDTTLYSNIAVYKAGNRVYIDAAAYSGAALYSIGALVLYSGNVYRCKTAIVVAESFTVAKWDLVGQQNDIFYCPLPQPLFNIKSSYNKDDLVFWNNKVYTCIIPSQSLGQSAKIQYSTTTDFPLQNVFPDDAKHGAAYWGAGVAYEVEAGSILDPEKFTKGDNRNQQLVLYVLDVLIYHLYRRIPPAVVPEIRVVAYRSVVEWLKNVARTNDVVADINKLQPPQGDRIRYGSRPKQENYY